MKWLCKTKTLASWLSWLERRPVTAEVVGSSPIGVVSMKSEISCGKFVFSHKFAEKIFGILAQLGEHLPYKQRVIGSSPIGPMYIYYAGVAELADARDLKSRG